MKTLIKISAINKKLKIKFGKFLIITPNHKLYPKHRRSKKCRHLILYMKKNKPTFTAVNRFN